MNWDFKPTAFQAPFLMSTARFPAYVAAWATGKTMCLIAKAMLQSMRFPYNKGLILRKNFVDLKNSTMSDFTRYTGIKVPVQSKTVVLPNRSEILFSHADEVAGVVQNINLGWFAIEQGEEFDSPEVFDLLDGRLRRDLTPAKDIQNTLVSKGFLKNVVSDFKELTEDERLTAELGCVKIGVPVRQGFCIANTNGHNWMWRIWKSPTKDYLCDKKLIVKSKSSKKIFDFGQYAQLTEAKTYDNYDNLPADFIASLEIKKETSPKHYNRFVLNSWEDTDTADKVFDYHSLLNAVDLDIRDYATDARIISVDPAEFGNDKSIIYGWKGLRVIEDEMLSKKSLMETSGHVARMYNKIGASAIYIDDIGVGAGCRARLDELNFKTVPIKSGGRPEDPAHYVRLRDEMYMYAARMFKEERVSIPNDQQLIEDLAVFTYDLNSKGQHMVERKKDAKVRLGRSPDRGDALIYGIWGQRNAKNPICLPEKNREELEYNPLSMESLWA